MFCSVFLGVGGVFEFVKATVGVLRANSYDFKQPLRGTVFPVWIDCVAVGETYALPSSAGSI